MKARRLRVSLVIAMVAIAVTSLSAGHFTPAATDARVHANEPAAASDADNITYYLLNGTELATLAARADALQSDELTTLRVAPQSVIAVISSPIAESQLRRNVDDANTQVSAFGEPAFRIVDLRPSAPFDAS